jgi:hypothetical protein
MKKRCAYCDTRNMKEKLEGVIFPRGEGPRGKGNFIWFSSEKVLEILEVRVVCWSSLNYFSWCNFFLVI